MELIIYDIAFIIIGAAIFGYIAKILKQPMIIAYIIAGLVIGPFGFNYINNEKTILAVSELGITFLLFLVGMKLNINRLKEVGKVVLIGGFLQVGLTALFSGTIMYFSGFSIIESFYLGIVLAFSSTLVVVKHLADKKEIDTLHGRIVVGVLVLQDLIVILAISILPTLQQFNFTAIGKSLLSGVAFIILAYLLSRVLLKRIFDYSAKDSELLFLSSLAICFIFAYLATLMGFTLTIGAFIAGVVIANLPYSLDIISKVKSLSTFFSALFFVALGMQIMPSTIPSIIIPLTILIVMAVVLKPLIVFLIIYSFGYNKKTSFITSIALGQVSEFSLILVAEGILLGHLSPNMLSLIITLTIVTMLISTYLLNNVVRVYHKYEHHLGFVDTLFKRRKNDDIVASEDTCGSLINAEVIINGYTNIEGTLLEKFMSSGKHVMIIDNDPDVVRKLKELKINCIYGDLADNDIMEKIDPKKVEIVMSNVMDVHDNLFIIKKIRETNKKSIIIVNANRVNESFELYNAGADYVVIPHLEGEKRIAVLLEDFNNDISKVISNKIKHIEQLRKRQTLREQIYSENGNFFTDIDHFIKETAGKLKENKGMIKSHEIKHTEKNTSANAIDVNQMIEEAGREKAGQEQ